MQIFQLIGQLKNNPNPMMLMQQIMGNNPIFRQVMQMSKGKNPVELKQTAINLCKTQGIDFNQVQETVRGMGLNL
ncbi:MAG: hypothetical protein LUH05_04225 [Candidatus Gastranaerophilales bacterium]|nr:hypothetical protein [Candidatus Gastranaerophilales bacterium]